MIIPNQIPGFNNKTRLISLTANPGIDIDFSATKTLPSGWSFSNSSTGNSFVNSAGAIEYTTVANQLRFDHDPITGECYGLLLENQATNLFTRSIDFSISYTTNDAVLQNNVFSAPDGNVNAGLLTEFTQESAATNDILAKNTTTLPRNINYLKQSNYFLDGASWGIGSPNLSPATYSVNITQNGVDWNNDLAYEVSHTINGATSNSTGGVNSLIQSTSVLINSTKFITVSIYVKYVSARYFIIYLTDAQGGRSENAVWFDLINNEVITNFTPKTGIYYGSGSLAATYISGTGNIQNVGSNGWKKVTMYVSNLTYATAFKVNYLFYYRDPRYTVAELASYNSASNYRGLVSKAQVTRSIDDTATNNIENGYIETTSTAPISSSVSISTGIKKYGSRSLFFNQNSLIVTNNNTTIGLASTPWTIEGWFYPISNITTDYRIFFTKKSNVGNVSSGIQYQGYYKNTTICFHNGTTEYSANATLTLNQWTHIAYVYDGTSLSIYKDGNRILEPTVVSIPANNSANLYIGDEPTISFYNHKFFHGYIDDFRITKGTARYTNLTYTTPSALLGVNDGTDPNFNNVTLLLNGENAVKKHNMLSNVSTTAGQTYCMSFYAKIASGNRLIAPIGGGLDASNQSPIFNLNTGTITKPSSNTVFKDAVIIPYKNGWYRCCCSFIASENTQMGLGMTNTSDNNSLLYQSDNTSGIYIWGLQLETGLYPTSFIKTTGSTKTRNAETMQLNFSSGTTTYGPFFYPSGAKASELSFFISFRRLPLVYVDNWSSYNKNDIIYDLRGASDTDRIVFQFDQTAKKDYVAINTATEGQIALLTFNTAATGTNISKVSFGIKTNDIGASLNNTSPITDNSGTIPSTSTTTPYSRMRLGYQEGVVNSTFNGCISRLIIWNKKFANFVYSELTK